MTTTRKLKFMSLADIEGLMFNPAQPSGIRLRRSGRHALAVPLIPKSAEDDPFGNRRGLDCRLYRSYSIDRVLFNFMDKLNSRIFTPYPGMTIKLPHVGKRRELIASDGTLAQGYALSWKHYPDDLKPILEKVFAELTIETQRFIKLLMWFFNISHVHEPVRHLSLYCNTRGRPYYLVNLPHSSEGHWQNDVVWNEPNGSGFTSLFKSASEEPLSHELFREAGSLLHSAPRSALLMLASALEVAVKSYITERAPVTQWLLTELQSPPVSKILRQFVPTLKPAGAVSVSNWSELKLMFNRLDKLITARNHLTHRGALEVTVKALTEFRDDVSDMLFIFDYLNGEPWARNNVRKQTCQALKWPDPITTQMQIRAVVSVATED
jgi:hypothetical protein